MREIPVTLVDAARQGDRVALEALLRAIQPDVYGLAVRMLWHPEDARDAAQEILLKLVTHLSTFRGESRFTTWAFRIAVNHLKDVRKSRLEARNLDFGAFASELADGLDERAADSSQDPEQQALLDEIKIGCTLAMLTCLDRSGRLAYILGEIFEMTDVEAAEALQVSPAAFRKRLSRARGAIARFLQTTCGIVNPVSRCSCPRRAARAIAVGRVDAARPLFTSHEGASLTYAAVVAQVRAIELARRAAALMRSNQPRVPDLDLAWLTHRQFQ